MPIPTPLDQLCDDHWDDIKLEDFLACVAHKLAERVMEDYGDEDIDEQLVQLDRYAAAVDMELLEMADTCLRENVE